MKRTAAISGLAIKFFIIRSLLALAAVMPPDWSASLARSLGAVLACWPNRSARTTLRNIRTCFPELADNEARQLARASLQHSLCGLLETGPAWLWPVARVNTAVRETEGVGELRQALASGSGAILLAPHLGNWEIFGITVTYGLPAYFMHSPSRWPAVDRLMRGGRGRGGLRMVPADRSGVAAMLRALRGGELCGILPDQVPSDGSGVFAPFFGQPAYTMTLACKLARRTGARVFCGYAGRLPGGAGFRVVVRETELARPSLEDAVASMNSALEELVRECPEQYQWEYKRFRRQPDDSEFYAG